MRELQLRDAKATLSAVLDEAQDGHPTIITRRGQPTAVVVSFAEWERLTQVPSFARLLMSVPLEEGDAFERNAGTLRSFGA